MRFSGVFVPGRMIASTMVFSRYEVTLGGLFMMLGCLVVCILGHKFLLWGDADAQTTTDCRSCSERGPDKPSYVPLFATRHFALKVARLRSVRPRRHPRVARNRAAATAILGCDI